jgi:hypothetical protein
MLRISVKDNPNDLYLKLEGKLVPPWTSELESVWHQILATLDGKKLHLDLCSTTFVGHEGMHILRAIVDVANPDIQANSPLTRQFAEQARCKAHA